MSLASWPPRRVVGVTAAWLVGLPLATLLYAVVALRVEDAADARRSTSRSPSAPATTAEAEQRLAMLPRQGSDVQVSVKSATMPLTDWLAWAGPPVLLVAAWTLARSRRTA